MKGEHSVEKKLEGRKKKKTLKVSDTIIEVT